MKNKKAKVKLSSVIIAILVIVLGFERIFSKSFLFHFFVCFCLFLTRIES